MKAIETTAVFEGVDRLRLIQHVDSTPGEVRIIMFFPQAEETVGTKAVPDFKAAIGSYYRDYPDELIRNADEWLGELREGETKN